MALCLSRRSELRMIRKVRPLRIPPCATVCNLPTVGFLTALSPCECDLRSLGQFGINPFAPNDSSLRLCAVRPLNDKVVTIDSGTRPFLLRPENVSSRFKGGSYITVYIVLSRISEI